MTLESSKGKSTLGRFTRRDVVRSMGAAGVGAAAGAPLARRALAQARTPMTLRFWSNDQPQQRGWLQKRFKLFTDSNPNVKIDYQWFPFGELGKKLSVGYATGTAPEGFNCYDWFMPTFLDKGLLAPMDVQRLGYSSIEAYRNDYSAPAVMGAIQDGKVYGNPSWFYGFVNYLNAKHFKEVGLDVEKDAPQTWEQFGEAAKRLTIRDGARFTRQGAKFAMHVAQWTMIQFNPILLQCGGKWFDDSGRCTVNSDAGVKAMTIRASLVRDYGAEDPADSVATNPLPQNDFLKERCSMFLSHPVPPAAFRSQNPQMAAERYYRPVQCPGIEAGKGFATAFGFNLVINGQITKDKQEVLHDIYKVVMGDLVECWKETGPFTVARKSGWMDNPEVTSFPNVDEIIKAKDQGVYLPRTVVYNELADAIHRAVQKIILNRADIKASLDEAAAEVDRATAAYKKG
jgi:multiple sugar transport system substrate-binding protein